MMAWMRVVALSLAAMSTLAAAEAAPPAIGEVRSEPGSERVPIECLLRPDGTLDLPAGGVPGSIDPTGFRLVAGPGEEPRFVAEETAPVSPSEDSDDCWDDRFYPSGLSGAVAAVVWNGVELFVGGGFETLETTIVNYVAKWDGTRWSPLGIGVNGGVYSLAWDGSSLYAGGSFTTAGGVSANRIARWDGTSWSPLGSGMDGDVNALAWSESGLYAGGSFTTAGGVSANRVARWSGTNWNPLGSGMDGVVRALAWDGSGVYAGGDFTAAGGVGANRVARWDGTNWSPLGSGVNSYISALVWDGSSLFAGGFFSVAGGDNASFIARWDGSSWSSLGSGLDREVRALAWDGSSLFVGGFFATAGGLSANGIARWDGTGWSSLGISLDGAVYALALEDVGLWAGGWFETAGGSTAYNLARWNGFGWSLPGLTGGGQGTANSVSTLVSAGGDVYSGGSFRKVADVNARYIARWDGTSWSPLGSGMTGSVYALAWDGSNLFAGGAFTTAGGVNAKNIAKWDGTSWSPLGSGISGYVLALAWDGSRLFAGGEFAVAGGVGARNIAKWDGASWTPLGSGASSYVYALACDGSSLYAGGAFVTAGGVTVNRIARWDGESWGPLGGGMNGGVSSLAWDGSNLYAGGYFTTAGGVAANRIARWDGTEWSPLGSGMDRVVRALAWDGSGVYAGGDFTTAGGVSANRIARWDGGNWKALGSGTNGRYHWVEALASDGSGVYAGGRFGTAGGRASSNIAHWSCSCPDNPLVDLIPNGPLTPCIGSGQLLSASLAGGTAPFRYQWLRDGVAIGGATSSTYFANDTGTHVYGCRIRGTGCGVDATDSTPVTITWTSVAPTFAGLAGVTGPGSAVCSLSLAWAAATTSCPGPISYRVYRSTTSGFVPSAADLVASGLTGTSFDDLTGLVPGTTYFYVVRAVDMASGAEDQNLVERSGVPADFPTIGIWRDDAGDTDVPKMALTAPWFVSATQGHDGPRTYKTGFYGGGLCAGLTTPDLQLATGAQLTFWSQYDIQSGADKGEVQLSTDGGSTWTRVAVTTYPGTSSTTGDACGLPAGTYFTGKPGLAWASYSASLAAWDNQPVRLRWVLSTNALQNGSGWWIDDVAITRVVVGSAACSTAPPNPKEAGASGGLRAAKGGGSAVQVTFDPACGATDHAVFWGSGPIAGALAWTDAACGLGTSGTATFDPGSTDPGGWIYFVPVGQNAIVEGSFGRDSALVERPEATGVGSCDVPQNLGGSCP